MHTSDAHARVGASKTPTAQRFTGTAAESPAASQATRDSADDLDAALRRRSWTGEEPSAPPSQLPPESGSIGGPGKHNLASTIQLTKELLSKRRIASVDDVIDHLTSNFGSQELIAALFRQQRVVRGEGRYLYFNAVSFILEGGRVERFDNPEKLAARIEPFERARGIQRRDDENLLLLAGSHLEEDAIEAIEHLLLAFYVATDVDDNQIEGAARLLVRRTLGTPDCLREIAEAITHQFQIRVGYYVVDQLPPYQSRPGPGDFSLLARGPTDVVELLQQFDVEAETRASLAAGLPFSGRIKAGAKLTYFKIVPIIHAALRDDQAGGSNDDVVSKARASFQRNRIGAVVLLDDQPIHKLAATYARALVDEYVGAPNSSSKIRALYQLSEEKARVQLHLRSQPLSDFPHQEAVVGAFAKLVCRNVVKATSADTASIRLLDPFRKTLKSAGFALSEKVPGDTTPAAEISVDDRASVNAYAFKHSKAGEFVYIKDMYSTIPAYYRSRGLGGIKTCRYENRSELCIPIFKTGLCIGTLNVESEVESAFDRDLEFVEAIALQVGDFIDLITRSSDAGWLPRLTFLHFSAHSGLKGRSPLSGGRTDTGADERSPNPRLSIDHIDPTDLSQIPAAELIAKARDFINELSSGRSDGHKEIIVEGEAPEFLSARHFHSLEVIFENILENACYHDRLEAPLTLLFKGDREEPSSLTISYKSPRTFVFPDTVKALGIAPKWDSENRIYHLGTFLAGVHTRLLGGAMWVDQLPTEENGSLRFNYTIEIPLTNDDRSRMGETGV